MTGKYFFGTPQDDAARLTLLGRSHDMTSLATAERYVGDLRGLRVLDIGSGDGSFAVLMADAVGPDGRITMADLSATPPIAETRRIRYVQCDIEQDTAPGGPYDLVHARMVFSHLADPLRAVSNAVASLAAGGTMYVADLDKLTSMTLVDAPPFDAARRLVLEELGAASNYDPHFGRRLPALFQSCGLTAITARGEVEFHFGGTDSAGLDLHVAGFRRLSEDKRPFAINDLQTAIGDERLISMGSMMVHALGRSAR